MATFLKLGSKLIRSESIGTVNLDCLPADKIGGGPQVDIYTDADAATFRELEDVRNIRAYFLGGTRFPQYMTQGLDLVIDLTPDTEDRA